MKGLSRKGRIIVTCILAAAMVFLAALIIISLVQSNPEKLNQFWGIGNGWTRLFGCLIGVLLLLLLILLAIKTYGYANDKAITYICGILIGIAVVIVAVSSIIYSGAATLEPVFTIESFAAEDDSVNEYMREEDIVTDDGKISIVGFEYNVSGINTSIKVKINNSSDEHIVFDALKYSILTPEKKIYYGSVDVDANTAEELSSVGEHSLYTRLYFPRESGEYEAEVTFSYYDESGVLHRLNDKKKKTIK